MKHIYYAWVNNESGARDDFPHRYNNKSALKSHVRDTYGSGWTVHVMAVGIDGDGESTFAEGPQEIEKFTIR